MGGTKRQRMSQLRAVAMSTVAMSLLAGCGTTYAVTHVPKKDLFRADNPPGIYFALPRTNVVLEFVAKKPKIKYGPFYDGAALVNKADDDLETFKDRLAANIKACRDGDIAKVEPIPDSILNAKEEFDTSDYSLSTESVPDEEMIYRLGVDAGPFTTYKHKVEWNDDGTLKVASTSVEDTRAAFALKVTDSLLKIAGAALMPQTAPPTPAEQKAYCDAWARLKEPKAEYDRALAVLEAKRTAILDSAAKVSEGEVLTVALAEIDKQIAALKKNSAALLKHFGKQDDSEVYVVVGRYDPWNFNDPQEEPSAEGERGFEWTVYKPKYEPAKDKADEAKRIPIAFGRPAATLEPVPIPADLKEKLALLSPKLTPALPVALAEGKTAPSAATVAGYPYRFPVSATIEILRKKPAEKPSDPPTNPTAAGGNTTQAEADVTAIAASAVPIAQFGPLLSLPSAFAGPSGEVEVGYNNATGGLTKAVIGGKAVSDTAASGYIDAAGGYMDAERKADDAAEKKAKEEAEAAASAETNALLKEKAYLEALKAVNTLRKDLGIDDDD